MLGMPASYHMIKLLTVHCRFATNYGCAAHEGLDGEQEHILCSERAGRALQQLWRRGPIAQKAS